MTDKELLINTLNNEPMSELMEIYIISAMRKYAKIKCQEQREICANEAKGKYYTDMSKYPHHREPIADYDSIINCPEPKFD
jgi:hypothetical protein